jgi:hypothetical protein
MKILNNAAEFLWLSESVEGYSKEEYFEFDENTNPFEYDYTVLMKEILDWTRENNIKYTIDCNNPNNPKIIFENDNDALIFKLTWGGNV